MATQPKKKEHRVTFTVTKPLKDISVRQLAAWALEQLDEAESRERAEAALEELKRRIAKTKPGTSYRQNLDFLQLLLERLLASH